MRKIRNYSILLGYLYENEARHVEEISIIERMYLYPDIDVYINDYHDKSKFLLIQKNQFGNHFAFIESNEDEKFVKKASEILLTYPKVQIQSGEFETNILKNNLKCISEYEYLIMKLNKENFTPEFEPVPIRLAPDIDYHEMYEISGGNPDRYREEIRYGIVYGFKVQDKWIALGGSGIRSLNYHYIFIETDTQYRHKGLAKAILSHSINDIFNSGKIPIYALDASNEPSMHLSLGLGFEPYLKLTCILAEPY